MPDPQPDLLIQPDLLVVAVPNGMVDDKLRFSLVLSPFARANRKLTTPEQAKEKYEGYWTTQCRDFNDWPALLRDAATSFQMTFVKEGKAPVTVSCTRVIDASRLPRVQRPQGFAKPSDSAVWDALFNRSSTNGEKPWIEPQVVLEPPTGADADADAGAKVVTPGHGTASADSQQQLGALMRDKNRDYGQIVEGITTAEMSRLFAIGAALQASEAHRRKFGETGREENTMPTQVPVPAQVSWQKSLRRMDQVIDRQNQLGSAGGTSATLAKDESREGSTETKAKKLESEFHHRLGLVDDHPALLRMLGLIVDVEVEIPKVSPDPAHPELSEALAGELLVIPRVTLGKGDDGKPKLSGRTRPTRCLLQDKSFTAVRRSESRLSDDGRNVDPRYLDTIQWDVESGVRSVLRRSSRQADAKLAEANFATPASYGVTVFWNWSARRQGLLADVSKNVKNSVGTVGALDEWHTPDSASSATAFHADDLVVGYVPAVHVIPDVTNTTAHQDGRSLTGRKLSVAIDVGNGPIILQWEDEMPLVSSLAEAMQPLAGWVVRILDSTFDAATSGTAHRYLVSTTSGFTVVSETIVAPPDPPPAGQTPPTEEDSRSSSVRDGLLATSMPASPIPLGHYCQFQGMWDRASGCFIAKEGRVLFGTGLAGRIAGSFTLRTIRAQTETDSAITLAKIPLSIYKSGRKEGNDQILPDQSNQPPTVTYAYLRGTTKLPAAWNILSASNAFRYFQGRGDTALAVTEDVSASSNGTRPPLRLPALDSRMRYIRREGEIHFFILESASMDSTGRERLQEVKLRLAADVKIIVAGEPPGTQGQLSPNAIYMVKARLVAVAGKGSQIQAVRLVEVVPGIGGVFQGMTKRMVDNKPRWTAAFTLGGRTIHCIVNPTETQVSITTPESRIEGTWQELGMRLDPDTSCTLILHLQGERAASGTVDVNVVSEYHLDRVEATWTEDENRAFYAISPAVIPFPGDEFVVKRISKPVSADAPAEVKLTMAEECEILSLPAQVPPVKPWRVHHHLPPNRLIKVRASGTPLVARSVEVIDSFTSAIVGIKPDEIQIHLPGNLTETQVLKFTPELSTAIRAEWPAPADGASYFDASALAEAVVKLGENRLVEALVITLPGHILEKNGLSYWTNGDKVSLPLPNPRPDTLKRDSAQATFTFPRIGPMTVEGTEVRAEGAGNFTVQVQQLPEVREVGKEGVPVEYHAISLILSGIDADNPAMQSGNFIPVFVEAYASGASQEKDVAARRAERYELLKAAVESGFPLELEAEPALLIEAADSDSANWEIIAATPDTVAVDVTPIKDGTDVPPQAWRWKAPMQVFDSSCWATGQPKEQSFHLVYKNGGDAKLQWPLGDGDAGARKNTEWGDCRLPENDQVIADDVLFHWNGWSLAGGPDHPTPPRKDSDQLLLPIVTKSSGGLPKQRVGNGMRFQIRVMDLAGNVDPLAPKADLQKTLRFQPFGKMTGDQDPPSKFLRFTPLGAPLVWLASSGTPSTNGKPPANGAPGGKGVIPSRGPTPAADKEGPIAAELTLFTDRARLLNNAKARARNPEQAGKLDLLVKPDASHLLFLMPPPVHRHLAQTFGGLGEPPPRPPRPVRQAGETGPKWQVRLAAWEKLVKQWREVDLNKYAEKTFNRISKQTDWEKAKPYKEDKSSRLADTVMDPHVGGFLVHSQQGGSSFRLKLPNKAPADQLLQLRIGKSANSSPATFNLRPEERGVMPREFRDASSQVMNFLADSEVTVRIHGNWKDEHASSTFLAAFLKWAEAGKKAGKKPQPEAATATTQSFFDRLGKTMKALAADGSEEIAPDVTDFDRLREALGKLASPGSTPFLLHPWISTPRVLRVRHLTNQPYQEPKLLKMDMQPRLPGNTHSEFRATYQIHRPSTGFLEVQAALEEEYRDDPRSEGPAVPPEEMLAIYEDPDIRKEAHRAIDQRFLQLRELHEEHSNEPLPSKSSNGSSAAAPAAAPVATDPVGNLTDLGRTRDLATLLLRPPLDVSTLTPSYPSATHPYGSDQETVTFRHEFDDTKHRTVYYRGIAHSRHGKEAFTEDFIETNPATIHSLQASDQWARVEIPATVPPADLNVSDITVLFEWSEGGWQDKLWWTDGGKSWEYSRTRRSGHRLWIERPWYSSGSGEKLAVLLWMNTPRTWEAGQEYAHLVSRWGADPVFETELPSDRLEKGETNIASLLTREDFVSPWSSPMGLRSRMIQPPAQEENPDTPAYGSPAATPVAANLSLPQEDAMLPPVTLPVGLVAYTPRYHPQRKQWYADVFVEPRSYCPFISYTVARYQPCSLPQCALSLPRRLRMLQALPTRTVTVTATCRGLIELQITLSGIFPPQNRRCISVKVEKNSYLEESTMAKSEAKADFNNFELGWEAVPIIDEKGSSTMVAVYHNPVPAPHSGNPEVSQTAVKMTIRLPRVPVHFSRWSEYSAEIRDDEKRNQRPCQYLRLSITEDEIHPYAHAMPEDLREGPRRIFADQVLLPHELLNAARLVVASDDEENNDRNDTSYVPPSEEGEKEKSKPAPNRRPIPVKR